MKKLIIFAIGIIIIGCKPIEKLVYVEKPIEVPIVSIQKDTINVFNHDSTFMFIKGDTTIIERWKTRLETKIRIKTDTVSKPVYIKETKTITVEVKKKGLVYYFGCFSIAIFAICILFLFLRLFKIV